MAFKIQIKQFYFVLKKKNHFSFPDTFFVQQSLFINGAHKIICAHAIIELFNLAGVTFKFKITPGLIISDPMEVQIYYL